MKIIYFVLTILLSNFIFACSPQNSLGKGLSGVLIGNTSSFDKIYLLQVKKPSDFFNGSASLVIDSAAIAENRFVFPDFNELDTNFVYRLNLVPKGENPGKIIRDYQNNSYIFLVNEQKPIRIHAEINSVSRTYSVDSNKEFSLNDEFARLRDLELPIYGIKEKYTPLFEEAAQEPEKLSKHQNEYIKEVTRILHEKAIPAFEASISNAQDERLTSYALIQMENFKQFEDNFEYYQGAIARLARKNHPYTIWWEKRFSKEKITTGVVAPDILASSIDGEERSLYKTKGKLILVDFWASWCAPCRSENREIVLPLYNKYRHKGFNVYGVSFDKNKDKWSTAITKDNLTWTNVSDLQGNTSPIWKKYNLTNLPTTLLLDEKYKIIAKNLRGQELTEFVQKYLEEKD